MEVSDEGRTSVYLVLYVVMEIDQDSWMEIALI